MGRYYSVVNHLTTGFLEISWPGRYFDQTTFPTPFDIWPSLWLSKIQRSGWIQRWIMRPACRNDLSAPNASPCENPRRMWWWPLGAPNKALSSCRDPGDGQTHLVGHILENLEIPLKTSIWEEFLSHLLRGHKITRYFTTVHTQWKPHLLEIFAHLNTRRKKLKRRTFKLTSAGLHIASWFGCDVLAEAIISTHPP